MSSHEYGWNSTVSSAYGRTSAVSGSRLPGSLYLHIAVHRATCASGGAGWIRRLYSSVPVGHSVAVSRRAYPSGRSPAAGLASGPPWILFPGDLRRCGSSCRRHCSAADCRDQSTDASHTWAQYGAPPFLRCLYRNGSTTLRTSCLLRKLLLKQRLANRLPQLIRMARRCRRNRCDSCGRAFETWK